MEELNIESTVVEMEQPSKEKTPAQHHQMWQKEMDAAEKRVRKYKKQGAQVVKRYLDDRESTSSFEGSRGDSPSKLNLFHKNISTTMAMLYGNRY